MLALALLLGGCARREPQDSLLVQRRLPLPAARAASLAIGAVGRLWIGEPGAVLTLEAGGRRLLRTPLPTRQVPRFAALLQGGVVVQAGGRILRLEADSAREVAARAEGGAGPLLLLPGAHFLYLGTPSGAVLGLDADSLDERWSWPRLGAPATALAASPEGDRIYLALGGSEEEETPRLLVRDAQTGRTLQEIPLPQPARALQSAPDGTLLALVGGERRGSVLALRPGAEGEVRWRRPLASLGLELPLQLRLAPDGARLALFRGSAAGAGDAGDAGALALLDARSGEPLGQLARGPQDAAFTPDGTLVLLYPGELRWVR